MHVMKYPSIYIHTTNAFNQNPKAVSSSSLITHKRQLLSLSLSLKLEGKMAQPMMRTESGRFVKPLGDGKALLLDEVDSLEGEEVTLWPKGQEQRAKASKSLTEEDTKKYYFTPEEYAVYSRKLRASEGFDVGDVPARIMLEVIRPVHHQSDPLALQQAFAGMAEVAFGVYNENQGTRYQFFQVIRVNCVFTGALWYYITFQAKNVNGSQVKNFQARTSPGRLGSEAKVEFCRVEPKPELPEGTSSFQLLRAIAATLSCKQGPSETSVQQQQ
ncbi:hypothetical protein RHMOL_Rhmol06G0054300 [Rhododendron molle]|uniref:Uncharacterized protein n=1 Tax=Rhododendron molle TaxID=49168 RepID=A0ACC0N9Y1_RHOML|nr:hypothetical protein RHMOL_Rhmol06G0054300 [Rhododendron molle]